MRKVKRASAILILTALATSLLTGCAGQEANHVEGQDKVAAVFMSLNSDYWHMIEAGCKNAGKELGMNVTVMGPTIETDVTGQIAMVEDQIAAGAKGIILAPCDPNAIIPVLQKAKDKNVPVVLIDGDISEENAQYRASFIGTSEFEAGEVVGQYVVDNFEPCEIAIVRGVAGAISHTARQDGFKSVVEAQGFKVVNIQAADSERGKAVNVTENILESNPNVEIIYCTNDEMGLGAYQAVEAKKKQDDIFVIGFDGSPDALKSIKDGKLDATLAQKPIEMGYKGVEAIKTLLNGGSIDDRIFTDTQMVDSENVEAFESDLNQQLEKANS